MAVSPTCFVLTDCSGQLTPIIFNNDLSLYVGKVIAISTFEGICWQVTCSGADCSYCVDANTFPLDAVITVFDTCLQCNPICYILTDCSEDNPHDLVKVTNDLSIQFTGNKIVKIPSYYGSICWTITQASDCTNSITIPDSIPIISYDSCFNCSAITGYQLTDCTGELSPIITRTNLSAEVGKVINGVTVLPSTPHISTCWTVSLFGPSNSIIDITFNPISYLDCECCLPQPPIPPKPLIPKVIPAPVKIFYRIEESDCDIRANQQYANGYGKLVNKLRFGISSCCNGIDFSQIWLKKQLSDLSKLMDPNYCPQHISPCFPNPCNTITTCPLTTQCSTCSPCPTCRPGFSLFPCEPPCSPFPGDMCYTNICISSFVPCFSTPEVLDTFSFQIGGVILNTTVGLDCFKTQDQLQIDINNSILNSGNTRIIITSFDENGICFYLEKTSLTPQLNTNGSVTRTSGVGFFLYTIDGFFIQADGSKWILDTTVDGSSETISASLICSLITPNCVNPIPIPPGNPGFWLWTDENGDEGLFRQSDGSRWLLGEPIPGPPADPGFFLWTNDIGGPGFFIQADGTKWLIG